MFDISWNGSGFDTVDPQALGDALFPDGDQTDLDSGAHLRIDTDNPMRFISWDDHSQMINLVNNDAVHHLNITECAFDMGVDGDFHHVDIITAETSLFTNKWKPRCRSSHIGGDILMTAKEVIPGLFQVNRASGLKLTNHVYFLADDTFVTANEVMSEDGTVLARRGTDSWMWRCDISTELRLRAVLSQWSYYITTAEGIPDVPHP